MTTHHDFVLSPDEVTRTLDGWQDGDGSLVERLATAMAAAIRRGELAAGWRLPPERELAAALSQAPPVLDTLSWNSSELLRHTGYWPLGYPPLRRAVAALFQRRGLPTTDEEVLITSGAQQAIALTAFGLCRPGDVVALDDPTFPGAIDAFRRVNARLLPLPTDTPANVDAYATTLAADPARVLYVMSTVHNPTGRTLSREQRRTIARAARRHEVLLIEDETLAELAYDGAPTPLAAMAPPRSVITIGSLSKVYWGGLRIGWIRATPSVIEKLGRLKTILDLSCAAPSQQLAVELLAQHDELRAHRVSDMRSRSALLLDLLAHHLGEWHVSEPRGGLFVWARLPHGSATELAMTAARHGVAILPGPATSPIGRFDDHVRISFTSEPDALTEGITRLARAWHSEPTQRRNKPPRPGDRDGDGQWLD